MGLFNKKTEFNSISVKEFQEVKDRVGNVEAEIEKLRTHINSLRGFVNKKLGTSVEKTEELKSPDGLDELR